MIGKMTVGTRDALERMETVTVNQFGRATGIHVKTWIGKCPSERCFGILRMTATRENEYALFCEECGWLPSDGFTPESYYITLPELEQRSGISYNVLVKMAADGELPAVDFGKDERSSWRVPAIVAKGLSLEHNDKWKGWSDHWGKSGEMT
jgi:hypothetical protein